MFTDTDSLAYETGKEDVYEDCDEDRSLFDFSDFQRDSKFFDPVKKKVNSKMKDEFKGEII